MKLPFVIGYLSVALAARPSLAAADEADGTTHQGYLEFYYQWNTGDPSNDLSNWRGFDNRHNSLTVANAALATTWKQGRLTGNLALQVGPTAATYYAAEPALAGGGGANATGPELWRHIQQANVAYKVPSHPDLDVAAGIFLSPIGPESIIIHDNWNWSRSNLFFGLPFYHAGAREHRPKRSMGHQRRGLQWLQQCCRQQRRQDNCLGGDPQTNRQTDGGDLVCWGRRARRWCPGRGALASPP
ncbi:MAG: outer membrane beta-barrel protein [Myxococcales bacterium]|nr:outer membrane beta-barrel protein [Myxococcales bacterium]